MRSSAAEFGQFAAQLLFAELTLRNVALMSSKNRQITGRQIAAARELLDITQRELAGSVGIFSESLARIEAAKGTRQRLSSTMILVIQELERRGIEFINGTGVKLRTPATEQESAGK